MTDNLLTEEEITSLLRYLSIHGFEETRDMMMQMSIRASLMTPDMDEIFIERYKCMLDKARECDDPEIQRPLYQFASILRIVAHTLHLDYVRNGKENDDERFLRLVPKIVSEE